MTEKEARKRATEIFTDPVFTQIYNELDAQYMKELRQLDPTDNHETTRIPQALQVMDLVKNHLHKLSQGMRLETEDLKNLKHGRRR